MRIVIIVFLFALLVPLAGYFTVDNTPTTILLASVGVAIFFISFVNIEIGLYILILSMLLSPEFMAGGTEGASLGRGVTLRYEDFLLVIIGGSWFAKNAVIKEIGLFRRTELNLPIMLYVIACVISTGFGIILGNVSPKTGFFFVLKYVEYFIVFFMIANHVESENQVKRFLIVLFFTCFVTCIIGIIQIPAGGRVSAPFEGEGGEPNTFGGYLVLTLSIAVGLIAYTDSKNLRNVLILLVVFIFPPLMYTQSRSSYLALIFAALTLAFFSKRRLLYVTGMILFFVLSPFLLPSAVKDRVLFTVAQRYHAEQIELGGVRIDTSTSARLVSWREAFRDWTKRPILGYGVTGYHFLDAQLPRVLAETGAVGMFAFLYLMFSILRMSFINFQNAQDPMLKGISYGFMAGFIGMLFHSLGSNTFIIVRIMEPFWFYAGIVAMVPELDQAKTPASIAKP